MPKIIYAKWLWTQAEPWLETEEEMRDLADKDESVFVGEYKLVKVHKVDLKLTTSK